MKLANRSLTRVFVGYPKNCKGYQFYNQELNKMFVSRDAMSPENSFGGNNAKVNERLQDGGIFELDEHFYDSMVPEGVSIRPITGHVELKRRTRKWHQQQMIYQKKASKKISASEISTRKA